MGPGRGIPWQRFSTNNPSPAASVAISHSSATPTSPPLSTIPSLYILFSTSPAQIVDPRDPIYGDRRLSSGHGVTRLRRPPSV